jgi:phenylalanyl-tRNA synthetase beta chain
MKIAHDVLERFTDLPSDPRELRMLLDDLGLEVKRVDRTDGPAVFTLELLANRGDHHCYEGIAREITGRTGLALRTVTSTPLDTTDGNWPIERHTDLVLVYTATVLVKQGDGQLAPEARRTLDAAGIHAISAPVDATNLVNLELGQPTHVFDADKVDGAIVLRTSVAGERAWPLFQAGHVDVPEGTLVIADRSKILAIAGVIGCEDSKATDTTTRLVLESACFDPVAVRKASRALGVHTDSSARFERGADPARAVLGAGRVVHLLEAAGWKREGGTSKVGAWTDPGRVIPLSAARASAFLDVVLSSDRIAEILERYGFGVAFEDPDRLDVSVPTWRLWDVEYPADLYEELAKSLGYGSIPTGLPPVGLGSLPSPAEGRRRRIDELLVGAGFHECFTDGFYGRALLDDLGVGPDHPLAPHVQTENAIDRGYSFLKNNCLGQAVAAVAANAAMRTEDVKLFEWTRTFHPAGHGVRGDRRRPPCTERHRLWLICSGLDQPSWARNHRPADALFLKGLVEELAVELGLDLAVDVKNDADPLSGLLHPGRQASITLDGNRVGILGEVHPSVVKRFKIKRIRPCYLELRGDALLAEGSPPAFVEPTNVHPIERDLTFALPSRVEADSVAAWLHASGPDWLQRVTITDLFAFDAPDGTPRRAVSYALRFDPQVPNTARTRTADEVNQALEQLVTAVHEQFGSAGVVQR